MKPWQNIAGRHEDESNGRAASRRFLVRLRVRQKLAASEDRNPPDLRGKSISMSADQYELLHLAGTVSSQPGQEADLRWLGSVGQGQLAADFR
jgi:hypothetical protein